MAERVWKYTWSQGSIEIEVHHGAQYGGSRLGGRHDGSGDSNHWLTPNSGNFERSVRQGQTRDQRSEMRNEK